MKAITVLEATAEDAEVSTVPASLGPYVQYYPPSEIYVHTLKLRHKVEKILKGRLDSMPSPSHSVKIQIMDGKVCLRCTDKTFLCVVNKLFKTKSLLTSPSIELPYYLK
jgi:hypothetical protein